MREKYLEEDALLLVEQNFYFLQTGAFFTTLSKEYNLSHSCNLQIIKEFDKAQVYRFNENIIRQVLENAKESSKEETILFEYFVEMNAFRGICMAMVEALKLERGFKHFLQEKLAHQFDSFVDIISFVRNVLSHNIHADIYLDEKDYEGTLKRILRCRRDPNVHFDFLYSRDLEEIQSPAPEYGFKCTINFQNLNNNTPFLEVISLWELMMLSELCFNLVIAYRLSKTS
ncbi:hypothetical protein ACM66Z_07380 [Sulfurovum sp. ST-21]|uniref:Uncharacterized protein n=1 Tax=Sulfurovum indicum TaxID=2779528 RepID=A0A7M1S3G5_9BACT|nr:hypothetical protein [Sulfurovum indicum]QOR61269.1 hypothetical protein IMZ28_07375 [Sulfurovum indicum]